MKYTLFAPLLLAVGVVLADEPADAQSRKDKEKEAKELEGMSILGNQEAPKALVIVPWKSSEIGEALGIAPMLDDSTQPVDREVFLRALSYYEIRSETTRQDGAPETGGGHTAATEKDAAQPATAAHRRHS